VPQPGPPAPWRFLRFGRGGSEGPGAWRWMTAGDVVEALKVGRLAESYSSGVSKARGVLAERPRRRPCYRPGSHRSGTEFRSARRRSRRMRGERLVSPPACGPAFRSSGLMVAEGCQMSWLSRLSPARWVEPAGRVYRLPWPCGRTANRYLGAFHGRHLLLAVLPALGAAALQEISPVRGSKASLQPQGGGGPVSLLGNSRRADYLPSLKTPGGGGGEGGLRVVVRLLRPRRLALHRGRKGRRTRP